MIASTFMNLSNLKGVGLQPPKPPPPPPPGSDPESDIMTINGCPEARVDDNSWMTLYVLHVPPYLDLPGYPPGKIPSRKKYKSLILHKNIRPLRLKMSHKTSLTILLLLLAGVTTYYGLSNNEAADQLLACMRGIPREKVAQGLHCLKIYKAIKYGKVEQEVLKRTLERNALTDLLSPTGTKGALNMGTYSVGAAGNRVSGAMLGFSVGGPPGSAIGAGLRLLMWWM